MSVTRSRADVAADARAAEATHRAQEEANRVRATIPKATPVTQQPRPVAAATHTALMAAAGIAEADYPYVEFIINAESGWRPDAVNRSSGAEGLPQALPYTKTGCAHGDGVCQLIWANGYAVSRYGGWRQADLFWRAHSWW